MKKLSYSIMALIVSLLLSAQALALDIGTLKDQGIVGEMSTGYVGIVVSNPSPQIRSFVQDINDKRRTIYAQEARKANITLAEVEAIAAKRNLDKTQRGHYININGAWRKK
ncbi:YdbL family protein [Kangiella aquimarina]|uniref:YdbL family protein n=1 Tax=Kangiella aquimarina TaxID=261965 RepID=A0ABZ0X4Y5_9GAMM|nr:YdbL family protein [Kangiella aquimarina]WQG85443.1 YdbL family protein [Kangiella aquimarina]